VITSWNRGAETLDGYSAEEMIGQAGQVLLPVDRREEREITARVLAGAGTERWESMRRRKAR
jgi:PAS domain S-box-containing protein